MKKTQQKAIYQWFQENKRPLPWRKNKEPYKIWISEIMLQQTTTTAVIPYFKNFIKKFPNLKSLATAPLEEVYEAWAGLGYYSRARNLHKAAKELHQLKKFPHSHEDLIQLPGFGPYTSRSVSSIAFNEKVGVVDGNTIRLFSRFYNLKAEWWKTKGRQQIQELVDQAITEHPSSEMNPALMELGSTICTAQSPSCLLCPLMKSCQGRKAKIIDKLPLRKAKKASEIWVWQPIVCNKKGKIALQENLTAPFLKKQFIFPGEVKKQRAKPKNYDFSHSITHHNIYVKTKKTNNQKEVQCYNELLWLAPEDIKKKAPFSLIQKVLKHSAIL